MELILFLAVVVMGVLLADARSRLARLEGEMRDARRWEARRQRDEFDAPPPVRPVEPEPIRAEPAVIEEAPPTSPPEIVAEPEPAAAAPLAAEAEVPEIEAPAREETASAGFEDLFGRKLPVWAGGITLVVAAVLLVKYSIDAGLLSPLVRVVLGFAFGASLIAGAEAARRLDRVARDERVPQALSGAGVGSLYAAALAAANLYHLIAPDAAFVTLSAITALAVGLALRFGPPSAVLGLVGGLATPALVQAGPPNVPLLAGYLAIVIASLTAISRRQRWFWLGASALVGGAGWTAALLFFGGLGEFSTLALGALVLLLGIALPVLASGDTRGPALRAIAAVVASFQLAALVATGGYSALTWGLYGVLALAFLWLTARLPLLRPAIAVPLVTSLALAASWPTPEPGLFALVMAGIVLIFGGSAGWRVWRPGGSLVEACQLAGVALAGYLVCAWHFFDGAPDERFFALLAAGFATLPAAGAALGWAERAGRRFALLASAAAVLLGIAALIGLLDWTAPVSIAVIASATLFLAVRAGNERLAASALLGLAAALVALVMTGDAEIELARFAETAQLEHLAQTLLRWTAATAATAVFAWRFGGTGPGKGLQGAAALLGYGLAAQLVPAPWLGVTAALGALAAAEAARRGRLADPVPSLAVLAAIAILWALEPLALWLLPAIRSLSGDSLLAASLPQPGLSARQLLVPALIGGAALWRMRERLTARAGGLAAIQLGLAVLVGVHILYKQVFHLDGEADFIQLGLAERTLWELLLIGAGFAAWRWLGSRTASLILIGIGIAHNLFYSLLLHDPLWREQALGSWPLANLLLPAFAIAFAAPALLGRIVPACEPPARRPVAVLRMGLIAVFAYASLRQLFAGSVIAGAPVTELENIGWSVLAIALAIGYLAWGIRHSRRDWRIASLLLMLAAVAKVFLFDAAGLDGLLRIASFLALGFSLIGIGWLYSRYLRPDRTE